MDKFFTAVLYIVIAAVLIIGYFYFRYLKRKRNDKIVSRRIRKKRYEDEKNYLRQYLMTLLPRLQSGEILWVLVNPKNYPQTKVEITFNSIDNTLRLIDHGRLLSETEKEMLRKIGITNVSRQRGHNELQVDINAKMIIDSVYFLFETVNEISPCMNLKIKHSGE